MRSRAIAPTTEGNSARLLELEDELVDRHRGARGRRVAFVLRMAQKIAFGHKLETRRRRFALDDILIDSMQALAGRHVIPGACRVVRNGKNAAGFEGIEK